jgi:hypothetical protein
MEILDPKEKEAGSKKMKKIRSRMSLLFELLAKYYYCDRIKRGIWRVQVLQVRNARTKGVTTWEMWGSYENGS